MRKIYLTAFFILLAYGIQAQYYKQAAGLRGGSTSGVTYKRFFTENKALNLMISGKNHGLQVYGAYENHIPLPISNNMFFYYGGGATLGVEEGVYYLNSTTTADKNYFVVGLNLPLGLEYRFVTPLTIGAEVRPTLESFGFRYVNFHFWDIAGIVRLTF